MFPGGAVPGFASAGGPSNHAGVDAMVKLLAPLTFIDSACPTRPCSFHHMNQPWYVYVYALYIQSIQVLQCAVNNFHELLMDCLLDSRFSS